MLAVATGGAALLITAGYFAMQAYDTHQRHRAAVAYCGAPAWEVFAATSKPALEEFDRVIAAAALTPRVGLGPMLLRLSEAQAKLEAVPSPPPCGKQSWQELLIATRMHLEGMQTFANANTSSEASAMLVQARSDLVTAVGALKAARANAVTP